MLPGLYLHGLSSGDFELAPRGLLGEGAPLLAPSLSRLKAQWQADYGAWKQNDLAALELVYAWAMAVAPISSASLQESLPRPLQRELQRQVSRRVPKRPLLQ